MPFRVGRTLLALVPARPRPDRSPTSLFITHICAHKCRRRRPRVGSTPPQASRRAGRRARHIRASPASAALPMPPRRRIFVRANRPGAARLQPARTDTCETHTRPTVRPSRRSRAQRPHSMIDGSGQPHARQSVHTDSRRQTSLVHAHTSRARFCLLTDTTGREITVAAITLLHCHCWGGKVPPIVPPPMPQL